MSLSQFHCTSRLYLDMHGLIFETSICYWQDQPGRPPVPPSDGPARAGLEGVASPRGRRGGHRAGPRLCPAGGLGPSLGARGSPGGARCGGRPSVPCAVPESKGCYQRWLSGPVAQLFRSCRQERGATAQRVRENELPERPSRTGGRRSCPPLTEEPTRAGRSGCPW